MFSLGVGAAGSLHRTRQAGSSIGLRTARSRIPFDAAPLTERPRIQRLPDRGDGDASRTIMVVPKITFRWKASVSDARSAASSISSSPCSRSTSATASRSALSSAHRRILGSIRRRIASGKLEQIEKPDLGKLIAKILPPVANHQGGVAETNVITPNDGQHS